MNKVLLILLSVLLLADVYLIAQGDDRSMRLFTKPFLIPLLLAFYVNKTKELNYLFLAGLVFSFMGDVFLLFSWGFLPGLGSFLTAHVLYIFSFKRFFNMHQILLIPILLAFVTGLLWFLFPYLNDMKLPVIIYALIISTMLYVAVTTQQKWLIAGALFFVISDTLLSINIFYRADLWREVAVMLTYIVAQLLLVKGMKQSSVFN